MASCQFVPYEDSDGLPLPCHMFVWLLMFTEHWIK